MDDLIKDYDSHKPLIDVLCASVEHWENTSPEFADFNERVAGLSNGLSALKILMEQHGLGVADLPEIGSKSLELVGSSLVLNDFVCKVI